MDYISLDNIKVKLKMKLAEITIPIWFREIKKVRLWRII